LSIVGLPFSCCSNKLSASAACASITNTEIIVLIERFYHQEMLSLASEKYFSYATLQKSCNVYLLNRMVFFMLSDFEKIQQERKAYLRNVDSATFSHISFPVCIKKTNFCLGTPCTVTTCVTYNFYECHRIYFGRFLFSLIIKFK
jgi:hypothetical protein